MNKSETFQKFDRIFIRVHIGILSFGLLMLGIAYVATDSIESIARTFLGLIYSLFYLDILLIIITMIRLLKYLFGFKNIEEKPSLRNVLIILFTSPVSLGIYFVLLLVMSLSLASCS